MTPRGPHGRLAGASVVRARQAGAAVTAQDAGQAAEQLRLSRPAPARTGEQVGRGSPDVDTENQDQENSGDDRGGDLPGEGVGVAPS